ncbi:MAG TPA: preprotein translocase subunit YajC [Jatrophihabitans sp.]|nr:preprotein translocase subunit YajC [Jatrophihabitans sp.]
MSQLIPIVVLALLLAGMVAFTRRNRARTAAADQERRQHLGPGSEVMTTSGLYGTVVSVNREEDSVLLAIAPGVEVRWTIAALRGISELPPRYRDGVGHAVGNAPDAGAGNGSHG